MSPNLERRDEAPEDDGSADAPDLFPHHDDAAASDDASDGSDQETIRGDRETIADILEEERQSASSPLPRIGGSSLTHRYRELVEMEAAQDSSSDSGAPDTIPRRVRSPSDSLLSIPDDSPSAQVHIYIYMHACIAVLVHRCCRVWS